MLKDYNAIYIGPGPGGQLSKTICRVEHDERHDDLLRITNLERPPGRLGWLRKAIRLLKSRWAEPIEISNYWSYPHQMLGRVSADEEQWVIFFFNPRTLKVCPKELLNQDLWRQHEVLKDDAASLERTMDEYGRRLGVGSSRQLIEKDQVKVFEQHGDQKEAAKMVFYGGGGGGK